MKYRSCSRAGYSIIAIAVAPTPHLFIVHRRDPELRALIVLSARRWLFRSASRHEDTGVERVRRRARLPSPPPPPSR